MKKVFNILEVQNIENEMLSYIDKICKKNNLRYYLVCGSVLGAVRHNGPIPWDSDVDITVPINELETFCKTMQQELQGSKYRILIPGNNDDINSITTFPRIALNNINPRLLHIDVFPQIGISSNVEEQEEHTRELTRLKTMYRDKKLSNTKNGGFIKVLIKNTYLKWKMRKVDEKQILKDFYNLCKKYDYEDSQYVTNPCGHYGIKNVVPKSYFGEPDYLPYGDMLLPVPEKTHEYLTHYYKNYSTFPPQEEIDGLMQYTITIEHDD